MPSLPARPAVRPAGMPTLPARPPKPANGTGPSGVSLFQYSCNILQDAFVYCYAIFKNDYGMLCSHGRQHKVSFLLYVWICKQYLVGPDRVHASLCRCSSSEQLQCWAQSAATEGKARGAVRGKRHAGACERGAVPDSPARRCSQHPSGQWASQRDITLCTKHHGEWPCARRAGVCR